jgi:hypothetical protein
VAISSGHIRAPCGTRRMRTVSRHKRRYRAFAGQRVRARRRSAGSAALGFSASICVKMSSQSESANRAQTSLKARPPRPCEALPHAVQQNGPRRRRPRRQAGYPRAPAEPSAESGIMGVAVADKLERQGALIRRAGQEDTDGIRDRDPMFSRTVMARSFTSASIRLWTSAFDARAVSFADSQCNATA